MSFVTRELARIQSALNDPSDANRAALFAAQQALAWSLEPSAFRSPLYSITGNLEDSEDCSAGSYPPPLSRSEPACADEPSELLQRGAHSP